MNASKKGFNRIMYMSESQCMYSTFICLVNLCIHRGPRIKWILDVYLMNLRIMVDHCREEDSNRV